MTPQSSSDNAAPPLSELGRITGVYLEPKKAFADIAARPRWYVPLILLVLAALAFTYFYTTHVGWEHYIRQSMENNPRLQNLSNEQRETQIAAGAKFAPIIGYVGSLIGIPLVALIMAAVLLLMCKMIGASLGFKQMFAISSYAMLPGLISSILAIIVMFLKDPEQFNLQNPLFFNLGALLEPPPGTGKFLYSLATSIDLFTFWTILLLATGISVGARKVSFSKALVAVVAPWVVWVLVKSVWAGRFG
jgi:Yip1 domain